MAAELQHLEDHTNMQSAQREERQRLEHEAKRKAAMRAKKQRLEEEARQQAAEEAERKRLEKEARQKAAEEAERQRLEEEARQHVVLVDNLVSRFPHKSREDVTTDLKRKGASAGTLAQMYRREAGRMG